MNDLLTEYKTYYKTRANQFAQDPDYANAFEAENNLSEAMQSCEELIEFKEKVGNLNELCAIGLVKDDSKLEYKLYDEQKEEIRKLASLRILEKIDQYANVQELITGVIDIQNKNSLEISQDEMVRSVFHDWSSLESIEELEHAIVPEDRKKENIQSAQNVKEGIVKDLLESENGLKEWFGEWKIDLNLIWEERHFRLLPYPKEEIEKRFSELQKITNR